MFGACSNFLLLVCAGVCAGACADFLLSVYGQNRQQNTTHAVAHTQHKTRTYRANARTYPTHPSFFADTDCTHIPRVSRTYRFAREAHRFIGVCGRTQPHITSTVHAHTTQPPAHTPHVQAFLATPPARTYQEHAAHTKAGAADMLCSAKIR